jgi:orotate phosphoribosyltransferase
MDNKLIIKLLKERNILKYGNFKLRNGMHSTYYCDIKESLGNPEILSKILEKLIVLIPEKSTCVVGSGYGGITLSSLISYKKRLPLTLVRDKIKDHGTGKIIDGYVPNKKDYCCIVDDVFTTGSSINDTKEKLSILKCKFVKPVVVLNRSTKNSVISILKDKDLLN